MSTRSSTSPPGRRPRAPALADQDLTEFATVIDAPLVDGWYDPAALGRLPKRGIDLLLVDGPPAGGPGIQASRYRALPALADRLAPNAAVVLDDADREGERRVLDRWLAGFPLRLDRAPSGLALAVYVQEPAGQAGQQLEEVGMRGTRRWLSIAVIGVIAAFAIYGCGGSDDTTGGSTTASGGTDLGLIEPGTLTIGSDIPYPPFEQGKPPDYTGFDVELMDEIAKRLDLTPKWVDTSFATIFTDLQAGKFDIVASSTTITPARSQQRSTFSDPYFDADQSLMVQKGSDLTSVDDITSDTSIAAQEGTTGQDYAEKKTDATVQTYAGDRNRVQRASGRPGGRGHQRLRGLGLRAEEVPGARRRPADPDGRALRIPDAEVRTPRWSTP